MTVAAADAKAGPYTGNDVASSFAFTFKVFADADIRVVEKLISTSVETDLVLTTNYTVTRNADQDNNPGGTVTYKVGGVTTALPSTKTLTIVGDFDFAQPTDIPNGGSFFAQVIENAIDRVTLLVKQMKERYDRSLKIPVSVSGVSTDLPAPQANSVPGWNAAGTALINYIVQVGTSLVDLAASTGATLVGAVGGAWTTVQGFINTLIGPTGSAQIGHTPTGTGAVATTVKAVLDRFFFAYQYTTFAQALTVAATGRLWVDSAITISANTTIPTGMEVYVIKGGVFNIANGVTLTINSPFKAPLSQVFNCTGTGSVKFGINTISEVYPEWFGAIAEADTETMDSTAAIQLAVNSTSVLNASTALNEGTTLQVPVKFSMGVYFITGLTVSHAQVFKGSGMKNTMIKSLSASTNLVNITAETPIEMYDLSFGVKTSVGAMTSGSFVLFNPVNPNQYSKLVRVAFNNCYTAVNASVNSFMIVDSCYFNKYSGYAIVMADTATPDSGDSTITNCTFNNGTGTAIYHNSAGGLRITNNKFSGGTVHYQGTWTSGAGSPTGQLIIANNSFDVASSGHIIFDKTGTSVFTGILIENNFFMVSASAYGILMNGYAGVTYLYDTVIGGNSFIVNTGSTCIYLASCDKVSILPNHISCNAGTTTGIIFSAADPLASILIHPQSFMGAGTITQFSGPQTAVTFIPGKHRTYAGNPNTNITPNYIGEECLDTTGGAWYKAKNTTNTGWILIG